MFYIQQARSVGVPLLGKTEVEERVLLLYDLILEHRVIVVYSPDGLPVGRSRALQVSIGVKTTVEAAVYLIPSRVQVTNYQWLSAIS